MRLTRLGLATAFIILVSVACSSGKKHLSVSNNTALAANFVWGPSKDDTVDWNTFASGGTTVHAAILPGQTSKYAVPPTGHYRWAGLESLPTPNMPGSVSQQRVSEGVFDSDGVNEITLAIGNGSSGDGGTGGDGGGIGKLCSKPSDCPSGFCVSQFCACDAQGHTKCPCLGAGAACGDDGECCSLSCGINANGLCD